MKEKKTAFAITIGDGNKDGNKDGVMIDSFEETLIFVGRLIERLCREEYFIGKYIHVDEYVLNSDGKYIKEDNLFSSKYLIKE